MTTTTKLHYSERTGRWMRCIAAHSCWYASHSTPLELARAGGAKAAINQRPQKVSALIEGAFSVSTAQRSQTFREDGSKLTPVEARAWRKRVAMQGRINAVVARGKAEHRTQAPTGFEAFMARKRELAVATP